ncbi:MAG: hypothetical protein ACI8PT_004246, partial [Gammaproteobacteria bacterium]
ALLTATCRCDATNTPQLSSAIRALAGQQMFSIEQPKAVAPTLARALTHERARTSSLGAATMVGQLASRYSPSSLKTPCPGHPKLKGRDCKAFQSIRAPLCSRAPTERPTHAVRQRFGHTATVSSPHRHDRETPTPTHRSFHKRCARVAQNSK